MPGQLPNRKAIVFSRTHIHVGLIENLLYSAKMKIRSKNETVIVSFNIELQSQLKTSILFRCDRNNSQSTSKDMHVLKITIVLEIKKIGSNSYHNSTPACSSNSKEVYIAEVCVGHFNQNGRNTTFLMK